MNTNGYCGGVSAYRLTSITIGSDGSGERSGTGVRAMAARAPARKVKWDSVQQVPRQMQFLQEKWTCALGGQCVEERWGQQRIYRAPRRGEDALAVQLSETAERKVKQLTEGNFNRAAADEEEKTKKRKRRKEEERIARRERRQRQKKKKKKKRMEE